MNNVVAATDPTNTTESLETTARKIGPMKEIGKKYQRMSDYLLLNYRKYEVPYILLLRFGKCI